MRKMFEIFHIDNRKEGVFHLMFICARQKYRSIRFYGVIDRLWKQSVQRCQRRSGMPQGQTTLLNMIISRTGFLDSRQKHRLNSSDGRSDVQGFSGTGCSVTGWTCICPSCGHVMDRDHQAAVNLREEALRIISENIARIKRIAA